MTMRRVALVALVVGLAGLLGSCGSVGGGKTTPPASIAFPAAGQTNAPPTSLAISGNAAIAAAISNGSGNAQVSWSASCGSSGKCGAFSANTSASGTATSYTAPADVPSGSTVTITATDSTSSSVAVSAQVTITSSVTVSMPASGQQYAPPGVMLASTTTNLAATLGSDPNNAGVNWSCTPASQCGTFRPTATLSGGVTQYTAPASVPSGGTVTVTATSVTDYTKMAQATIGIGAGAVAVTFIQTPPSPLNIEIPGNTVAIGANVANDPLNAGVNWSVTCGSAQCGSFTPPHTVSGNTTTYTAPSSVPPGATVTITATTADSNANATATIGIGSTIVVAIPSPPSSALIDSNTNIAATVTNDPNSAGVTWSCTPASLCGAFSPTATLSGANTSFGAPATVPAGNDVTVTATSVSDYSKSASATFPMTSNIVVAFSYAPPTTLNTNIEASLAAYTTGDPNNGGVNWTCTPASQCGTFGPPSTSNNQDTAYTAPLTVPVSNGGQVTVTATAVNDFNKSVSANITLKPTLPDGTYVFQLGGQDNNGSAFNVAGAFTMQSGAIIGGEQDFTDAGDVLSDPIGRQGDISGTSIGVAPDGNLQIILDTGDTYIGPMVGGTPDGLETLNVALVDPSAGSGAMTWFDSFAAASGTLLPQDSTVAQTLPEYGYAFYASGYDSGGLPVVMGGIINVDNPSGPGTMSGSGSAFDINDGSSITPESGQRLSSIGTVTGPTGGTMPDVYGRVVFTLDPDANPSVPETRFTGYIVNSSVIALVETIDDFGGVTGGVALAQGQTKTGRFSTADLSGSSYVVGAQGSNQFAELDFAGALSFNPDTTVSGIGDYNDSTFVSTQSTLAGNYSVDSSGTGRATVTGLTGTYLNCLPNNTDTTCTRIPATLQLYLDGSGNALVVSMDANDFTAGPSYLQSTSPSFSGSYAVSAVGFAGSGNQWSAAASITIGSGTIGSGSFTDFNYFGATLTTPECGAAGPICPDLTLTGTVSGTTGTITGLGAASIAQPPLKSDTFDFYVIDGLRAFGIESDTTQIGLLFLQQPPTPNTKAEQKRRKTRKP